MAMVNHKTYVGNVELVSLTDNHGGGSPVEIFPDSTMDQWLTEYPELLDGNHHIHPRFGSVAVRSNGKLILVDTGAGPPDGALITQMSDRGVDRNAVDLVVLTHLHADHIGWNLIDDAPTFPNARYLITKADWDYWTQPSILEETKPIQDMVIPLEDLEIVDLIEGEYKITDELITVPTPGHTPGHISISITSDGNKGFILGDVAHSVAQAHYTDWSPAFDVNPELARHTRHAIIDMLEEGEVLVSAGHLPEPGLGRFIRRNGRRIWQGI